MTKHEQIKNTYTKEVLLNLLGSYRRQILRSGKKHPSVVLSDILNSIDYVLEANDYNSIFKEDNNR